MSMRKRSSKLLFILAIFCLPFCGCNDGNGNFGDPLPYVFVQEQISISSLEAQPLTVRDGTFIYWKGGLSGLIVYRKRQGEYETFERMSPAIGNCRVLVDPTGFYMEDTCAKVRFNFDGTVSGGAVGLLRRYSTNFDGFRIIISN